MTDIRRKLDMPPLDIPWLLPVVLVFTFLLTVSVVSDNLARKYGYHYEQNVIDRCTEKGGVMIKTRNSQMLCIRRDAVID